MNPPVLFGSDKKPLQLGSRLGKGGEGEVFALANFPGRAVKVYNNGLAASRLKKISAMIDAGYGSKSQLIAFPLEKVADRHGHFAGFVMMKVSEHEVLHELYSPMARKTKFPDVDYRFIIRTAANIARAVAAVHSTGCVIGDINPSGILISSKATVALIDADSFQVTSGAQKFLCRVGFPEYTPPELQGAKLDTVTRTPNHDAFGLAVVIFQLLWMGRHPFAGRYEKGDMPLETAIREFRFSYSTTRRVGMSPPPGVPSLHDFPTQIGAAFEAAFGPQGNRLRAGDWVALLDELERACRRCASNPQHFYPQSANECLWCRMERTLGVQLFLPLLNLSTGSTSAGSSASDTVDLATLWRLIESVNPKQLGDAEPTLPAVSVQPTEAAKRILAGKWRGRLFGVGLVAVGVAIAAADMQWWFAAGGVGIWGFFQLIRQPPATSIVESAKQAEQDWHVALSRWYDRCGTSEFDRAKESLRIAKIELENLAAVEKQKIDAYARDRQQIQLKNFLDKFLIKNAKIKGVGPAKLIALNSYGIESAGDVSAAAVQRVPGFGPVNSQPLIDWRRYHEGRFRYDLNPSAFDRIKIAAIKAEMAQRGKDLRAQLAEGPLALRKILAQTERHRATRDLHLESSYTRRMQALADLKLLGLSVPSVPGIAPSASVMRTVYKTTPRPANMPATNTMPPTAAGGAAAQTQSCPNCGSAMVARTARRGSRAGSRFWGCSRYPVCRGTRRY